MAEWFRAMRWDWMAAIGAMTSATTAVNVAFPPRAGGHDDSDHSDHSDDFNASGHGTGNDGAEEEMAQDSDDAAGECGEDVRPMPRIGAVARAKTPATSERNTHDHAHHSRDQDSRPPGGN